MTSASLRALLSGLVDYAGLFPPAKLDMAAAVAKYGEHRQGRYAYGLARFICPVSRLSEFATASARHLPDLDAIPAGAGVPVAIGASGSSASPRTPGAAPANGDVPPPQPWTLSVLIDGPLEQNLQTIDQFNKAHFKNHHYSAVIDTVEIKVATPEAIEYALERLPEELYPFFEIPLSGDIRGFATGLAGTGAGAKIRTGGLTPDMFPTPEQVCDFLFAMNACDVAFKATAGLHHPIREQYPLTYEPGSEKCTMHGFINVFLAAAMLRECDADRATVLHLLGEHLAEPFAFEDDGVKWRGLKLPTAELADARENFCICFGSCSFDDPMNDLIKLGVL